MQNEPKRMNVKHEQFLKNFKEHCGISYETLHRRMRKLLPKPTHCQICGFITEKLDLANLSGNYLEDAGDFMYMCRRCHKLWDNPALLKRVEIDYELSQFNK